MAAAFSNVKHLDFIPLCSFFNSTLTFMIDKYAPLISVTATTRNSYLWSPPVLLAKRLKRQNLEHTLRISLKAADRLLYKNLCHPCQKA